MMDEVIQMICATFNQSRIVQHLIDDCILPNLDPARRTFATYLRRQIAQGDVLNEPFLRDLEAFISMINQAVSNGTHIGWEADEHHVQGGFDIVQLDHSAQVLGSTVGALWQFWSAIAQVIDETKASAAVSDLISD
jgi:hypothetical protein